MSIQHQFTYSNMLKWEALKLGVIYLALRGERHVRHVPKDSSIKIIMIVNTTMIGVRLLFSLLKSSPTIRKINYEIIFIPFVLGMRHYSKDVRFPGIAIANICQILFQSKIYRGYFLHKDYF